MRILSIFSALFIFATPVCALGELPDYLPTAPDADKAVANYTVADVMGVVCTRQTKLPAGHPFSGNKAKKDLRTEWPGSTVANNIDQFLGYLLLTPNPKEEKAVRTNIYWILHEVMNVTDAEKSAAIIRVHNAQTDIAKKRKIAWFAAESFCSLMNADLLILVRNLLDDGSVLRSSKPEGLEPRVTTMRGEVRRKCLQFILHKNYLHMEPDLRPDDYPHINRGGRTEQEYCSAMKEWMIGNWALITAKVAQAKANPDRPRGNAWLKVFNPRS